jgi:hypothetical protein
LIGCGNRGMYVSGIFAKNEFARVAAICDIYEDRIEAATSSTWRAGFRTTRVAGLKRRCSAHATPAYLHPGISKRRWPASTYSWRLRR